MIVMLILSRNTPLLSAPLPVEAGSRYPPALTTALRLLASVGVSSSLSARPLRTHVLITTVLHPLRQVVSYPSPFFSSMQYLSGGGRVNSQR
jgi:hypothetical protein